MGYWIIEPNYEKGRKMGYFGGIGRKMVFFGKGRKMGCYCTHLEIILVLIVDHR